MRITIRDLTNRERVGFAWLSIALGVAMAFSGIDGLPYFGLIPFSGGVFYLLLSLEANSHFLNK